MKRRRSLALFTSILTGISGCVSSPSNDQMTTKTSTTTTQQGRVTKKTNTSATTHTTQQKSSLHTSFQSRQRYRSPGHSLNLFTDLSAWESLQGTMVADPNGFTHSQSAKISGSNGNYVAIQRQFPTIQDLSNQDLSVAFRTTTPSNVALFLSLIDIHGNVAEHHLRDVTMEKPDIGWFRTCPGTYTTDSNFDRSRVDRIRIRLNNTGKKAVGWLDDVRTHRKPEKGYVILSWDDSRQSYYTKAAPVNDEFGVPSVIAAITTPGYRQRSRPASNPLLDPRSVFENSSPMCRSQQYPHHRIHPES